MASLQKNVASQKVTFGLVNASTGAALTSATFTSLAWVTVDGTQAGFAGTFTTLGNGQYQYAPTQGETNGTDIGIFIAPTGAVPVNLDFHTDQFDATSGFQKVDVEAINTSTTAAVNVGQANQAIGRGTCTTGGSATSITTSAWAPGGAGVVSGQFIGRTVIFDAGTTTAALRGQATNITGNTSGATPTFTVSTLTTAPSSGDTFGVY